ncbi:MAG TPA: hypothetical protein PLO69_11235 [Gammaproteobacteria bacterium]|nr:hypothetical protein [Gammaproteobacteria bacterium]
MIAAALGRIIQHCIAAAERDRRPRAVIHQMEPDYMTDQEISDFLHARMDRIDWNAVRLRKRTGALARPRQQTAMMELVP